MADVDIEVIPHVSCRSLQIYAEKSVPCAGYPLAAVFANTRTLAYKAASKVKVTYSAVKKPVFNVAKIVESGDTSRIWLAAQKTAASKKS